MDYQGGMMPYPPQGDNPGPRFSHKSRGQKNNTYRSKKHHRYPSNDDTPNICFNCGSPDHWAQHCPEPRRESHPGDVPYSHPPKRQKTQQFRGGPQLPPQDPYEYPPPPMGQADYDHMSMDPAYDQPQPAHGRWQQRPSPRKRYSYSQYPPHDAPPAMSGYGPQFSGPPGPPPPPHHRGYYPPEYPHGPGEADRHPYPPDYHHQPPQDRRHRQPSKPWKRQGNSRGPMPAPEPLANEFGASEKPEPQIIDGYKVWTPAMDAARPLPSTLDDRDEMTPLPPRTSLPRGMSISKYLLNRPPEDFHCNIRETEDWPFMMSDPIFASIPAGGEMIPWENLVARRNKYFDTHRVPKSQSIQDVNEGNEAQSEHGSPADENGAYDDTHEPDSQYDSPSGHGRHRRRSVHSQASDGYSETYNDTSYERSASSPMIDSEYPEPGLNDENDALSSRRQDFGDTDSNCQTRGESETRTHSDQGEQQQYNNREPVPNNQSHQPDRRFQQPNSSKPPRRRFMKAGRSNGDSAQNGEQKGSDSTRYAHAGSSMDEEKRGGNKPSVSPQEASDDLTNGSGQHSNEGTASQSQSDGDIHKHR